jgi:lipopolysaccharide transport system permease protein
MPVSSVISQLIPFAIQLTFFLIFWVYYLVVPSGVEPNLYILLFPLIILQLAMLGLGFGVIISACTTKYRDLAMAVGFGTQLWMYATPIAYDISIIPEKYLFLYMLNPVTPAVMAMRYAFLGTGYFDLKYYLISWIVTIVVLFIGVVLFSRIEKTFADTV